MTQDKSDSAHQKKIILLVEDEQLLVLLEKKILEINGYDVIVAHTGEEAIDLVKQTHTINLILMDINLGDGISGTEAARIILSEYDIPLVFLSSHVEKEIVEKTEGITSYGYIVKNSGETVLIASIKMAFKLFESKMKEKEKEEKIISRETYLKKILETTNDGFILTNKEKQIIDCNPSYCAMSGYTHEELLNLKINDLEIVEKPEETLKHIEKIVKYGFDAFETTHRRKDGSLFQVEVVVNYLPDSGGLLISFCRDITERKKAEEIFHASQERFKLIAENTSDGLMLVENGSAIYKSPSYMKMMGLTEEDPGAVCADDIMSKIHPDDYDNVTNAIINAYRQQASDAQYIFRARHTNGTYIWREDHTRIVYDKYGKPLRLYIVARDISSRKETEEKLLQLSKAVEQSPAMLIITDLNSKIEYVNPRFEEVTGYTTQEVIGKNPDFLRYGDKNINQYDDLWKTLSQGKQWKGEFLNRKKNGTPYYEKAQIAPIIDDKGNVSHYIAIKEDITEKKKVEEALKRKSELQKILMGIASKYINMPLEIMDQSINESLCQMAEFFNVDRAYIFTFDEDAGNCSNLYEWCNQHVSSQIGTLQNVPLDKSWIEHFKKGDYIHIPDLSQLENSLARQILEPQGIKSLISVPILQNDKLIGFIGFDAVENLHTFTDEECDLLVLFAQMYLNLCLRQASEKTLQMSLDRNKALLDANPDLMFIFDKECRIVDCHPKNKIEKHYADPAYFINQMVDNVLPEELAYITHQNVNIVLKHHKPIYATYSIEIEGEKHFYESRYVKNGEEQVLAIVRDITLNRQNEIEQEKLQTQLIQAQKMESVGRLAGGVAHDFNNMLSVILGYTEMGMMELNEGHPLYDLFKEIHNAATRSTNLTRQLLAFSRKQTISPKILDINQTLQNMIKMVKHLIGEDIRLEYLPKQEKNTVRIDPSQIDQIIANLCVNARDAIENTGIVIIETNRTYLDEKFCLDHIGSSPGEYVLIRVSDNGCGMDEPVLHNIFEPFFTTKDPGKGTGLGLATVYGIVKQNNGYISVESKKGEGTRFTIYLPYCDAPDLESDKILSIAKSNQNRTILLVEDESALLNLTEKMLTNTGYQVIKAASPKEALEKAILHKDELELLLTDVIMPEMNGKDLYLKVKELCPHIRLIYMSGYTSNIIEKHGVLNKDTYFLQKPFSIDDLIHKLNEVFQ
ncbi:MAG TPA: PAS domain S-box protein [Candidatus Cloacimonadota bacterium]|nr:PAS domain S-box protein [Candidatus Cloacimonadota bacterium]